MHRAPPILPVGLSKEYVPSNDSVFLINSFHGCSLVLLIISVHFLFCSTSHRSKRKEQVRKDMKKVGSEAGKGGKYWPALLGNIVFAFLPI